MMKELLKEILKEELTGKTTKVNVNIGSFLEVGKSYGFRTITMIYTGKIVAMTGDEIKLEKAAWIAETERWHEFTKTLSAKEIEPYAGEVVIFRGALLDVFECDEKHLPTEQK